jgi:hypothetical protein
MIVSNKFFDLFPNTMDRNQFVVFAFLIGQIKNKKDILKVKDSDLEFAMKGKTENGIGRDLVQNSLTWLADNGYIRKEQKRDGAGKFIYNEISITSDLVK